jgi:hypothetical protein
MTTATALSIAGGWKKLEPIGKMGECHISGPVIATKPAQ